MDSKTLKKTYPISCKKALLLLRIINNPIIQRILTHIWEEETYVWKIVEAVKEEQCVVSYKLGQLRKYGLVTWRREEKYIYYKANQEAIQRVVEIVERLNSKTV